MVIHRFHIRVFLGSLRRSLVKFQSLVSLAESSSQLRSMKIFFCPRFCSNDAANIYDLPDHGFPFLRRGNVPTDRRGHGRSLFLSLSFFLFFFFSRDLPSSDGSSSKVTGIPSSLIFTLRVLNGCTGIDGYVFSSVHEAFKGVCE